MTRTSAFLKSFSEYFLPSTPGNLKSGAVAPSGRVSTARMSAAEIRAAASRAITTGRTVFIGGGSVGNYTGGFCAIALVETIRFSSQGPVAAEQQQSVPDGVSHGLNAKPNARRKSRGGSLDAGQRRPRSFICWRY